MFQQACPGPVTQTPRARLRNASGPRNREVPPGILVGLMTGLEKGEALAIPLVSAAAWYLAPHLPSNLAVADMMIALSVVVLVQSLVRDLLLIARRKPDKTKVVEAQCLCVESAVGVLGLLVGLLLLIAGATDPTPIPLWGWPLGIGLTMLATFVIKDYVFEWSPWRLRRDPDHLNIVFSRKR